MYIIYLNYIFIYVIYLVTPLINTLIYLIFILNIFDIIVFIFSKYLGVFMKISGQFTHWLDPTLYFQETETCLELVKKNGFLWELFGSHNWGYQEMNPHYGHGWVPVPNYCHRTVFFPHLWTSSLHVLVQVTTIYPNSPIPLTPAQWEHLPQELWWEGPEMGLDLSSIGHMSFFGSTVVCTV